MKIFDKIELEHYVLGSETMKTETMYFFLGWHFWTSKRTKALNKTEEIKYHSLKQGADGHLEIDEQSEYLGII